MSERLAQDIADMIHRDHLRPGDSLQPARALAAHFDVTTPTIREALRRLEAASIVELRHGSGTYVGKGVDRAVMANPHQAPITREAVLELAEARLTLEPRIAAAAATNRTPDALERLELATCNALTDPRHGVRPALHFHVELAGCTGNSLIQQTIDALLEVRSSEQVEIRFAYGDRERDHAEHLEILAAVREQRSEDAEALTRVHLAHIRDAILTSDHWAGSGS
ncbi:GntR family transcriptional regulator [Mobilicoccus caccae]|uniref:GntR family transcriptional regulator n=1 Tax=Mobilicoccus caccae TaxID=1859295 RepID=A0ABQ6ITW6_9MICO|nr:GntR family transcriptional regulator [Mobilicoccus caccae]